MAAAGIRGKRERGPRGVDSPPQFHRRGPVGRGATAMVVAGRRPALAGAAAMLQSLAAAGAREKGEGTSGILSLSLPRAEAACGDGSTAGDGAVAAVQRAREGG